jgi:hypothetical protein
MKAWAVMAVASLLAFSVRAEAGAPLDRANYRAQINRVLRTTSFATLLARMRAEQLTAMAIPRGAGEAAVGASATPVVGLVQTYRVTVGMMAKLWAK